MRSATRIYVSACVVLHLCTAIQWNVFSTKTSYFWAHNTSEVSTDAGTHATSGNLACTAVHVNLVNRHGARNPTASSIVEIGKLHAKVLSHKDHGSFPGLNNWTNRYDIQTEGQLVPMGAKELEMLGKTYGQTFQSLFSPNFQRMQFLSSNKQRTKDSGRNFYNAFSSQLGIQHPFVGHVNDSLMRFYDDCPRYDSVVADNATNFKQYDDFSKTPEFRNVRDSIVRRLGLNVSLTPDEIYTVYDLCAYEAYIFNDTTWCGAMTDAERHVLEYGMDTQNYYESLYGNPMNTRVGCPLVRDIFYTMDSVIRSLNSSNGQTQYLVGKFQFGHSQTVGYLLAALGLFKDSTDFLATNMAAMQHRKFRSSLVLSYAAHVVMVLYRCDGRSGAGPELYLRLLVNGETVTFPMCGGLDMCSYETVRQGYASIIEGCHEKEFCTLKTAAIIG